MAGQKFLESPGEAIVKMQFSNNDSVRKCFKTCIGKF